MKSSVSVWISAATSAIAAGLFLWWLTHAGGPLNPVPTPPIPVENPQPKPAPIPAPIDPSPLPPPGQAPTRPEPTKHTDEFHAKRFAIGDGAQETILDGQVSIGAMFTQVGDSLVPTLLINVPGNEVESHAIMGAGNRFEIRVEGRSYFVTVAKIDEPSRSLTVQVDRKH